MNASSLFSFSRASILKILRTLKVVSVSSVSGLLLACTTQSARTPGAGADDAQARSHSLRFVCDRLAQLVNTEGTMQLELEISREHRLTANLEGAADGTGTFKAANLFLRVYDDGDDGALIQNRCLELRLEDRNGDGLADLVVEGALLPSAEDRKIGKGSIPFRRVYHFDPNKGNFHPADDDPVVPGIEIRR